MYRFSSYMSISSLFFYLDGDHRDLHELTHSFPTRRSSDVSPGKGSQPSSTSSGAAPVAAGWNTRYTRTPGRSSRCWLSSSTTGPSTKRPMPDAQRSEEHTSELQSLMRISYAVFCLKKKQHNYDSKITRQTDSSKET